MSDKRTLTDRYLKALKPAPAGKRKLVWDDASAGLAVRVTDKGRVSFMVIRRAAGDRRLVNTVLGQYPALTLGDARRAAEGVRAALAKGQRPREVEEERRREEARRRADTFEMIATDFCERLEAGRIPKIRGGRDGTPLRNPRGMAETIRRELVPAWRSRPVTEITKRDVVKLIEKVRDRGGERPEAGKRRKSGGQYAARHALSAARRLFDWVAYSGVIERSPAHEVSAVRAHGAPEARERVLTDAELRLVWAAAEATPYPFGPLVRMLILTGARRDEIGGARWAEIDLAATLLTIPAERVKGNFAHTVPLTPTASAILEGLPRFAAGDFVFSTRGDRPFSGYSKAKARLNAAVLALAREADPKASIPAWTLHDIRRSVRTGLSSCGVLPVVAELTIGHKQVGISAVYDRHRYDAEKRDALARWQAKLLSIVAPEPEPAAPNVVRFPAEAAA
jgi:integrase